MTATYADCCPRVLSSWHASHLPLPLTTRSVAEGCYDGSMHNPIVWITVANVLYLASYSVRDILWLRILTVVAAFLLIPYYLFQPVPLTAAIWWNTVFIAINGYWIVRLIIDRRPVHFTAEETRLRQLAFPSLTPREAAIFIRWECGTTLRPVSPS
jgi:hypothetical protein